MAYGNSITQYFYYKSPYIFKNIISTTYGLKSRFERYGKYYKDWFNFLLESQYYSNERLIDFRDNKTIEFINNVLAKNSFLSGIYQLSSISNISQLKEFPIIDKEFLRKNSNKIILNNVGKIKYTHTSGTTGSSLIFPITLECFQREYAFRTLHYSWSGLDLMNKPKIATFSGHPVAEIGRSKPPFWVYDYVNNWLLFSSFHLRDDLLKHYVNELVEFNPELIHGYPSSVYLIALALKKYGKLLKKLKAIYTASETLLDYQRKTIEEVFQTKVFNWYGNSEMCANIVECEKGNLHLKYEHSFVEILNEKNEDCQPGEKGRLVCTGFGNLAFPLIRYDIKDEVEISKEQFCPCGRSGLIISQVIGRIEDYILTPSGRKIGRLDHLFKDTTGIREAQIFQGKIDEIEIRLVPVNGKLSFDDEKKLNQEIKLRIGDELNVKIVILDKIERGPNNKFKFIISELKEDYAPNYTISKKR